MSRPIKYRGKRKDNGDWIEGYYGYKNIGDKHFIMVETVGAGITPDMLRTVPNNCHSYFTDYEVYPETVGQYTNYYGLEFYDEDVISIACDCDNEYGCFHPDSIHLVVWDEETAGYALKSIRNGRMYPLDEGGAENMTVIGNRWDHPHLLKGDKENE